MLALSDICFFYCLKMLYISKQFIYFLCMGNWITHIVLTRCMKIIEIMKNIYFTIKKLIVAEFQLFSSLKNMKLTIIFKR